MPQYTIGDTPQQVSQYLTKPALLSNSGSSTLYLDDSTSVGPDNAGFTLPPYGTLAWKEGVLFAVSAPGTVGVLSVQYNAGAVTSPVSVIEGPINAVVTGDVSAVITGPVDVYGEVTATVTNVVTTNVTNDVTVNGAVDATITGPVDAVVTGSVVATLTGPITATVSGDVDATLTGPVAIAGPVTVSSITNTVQTNITNDVTVNGAVDATITGPVTVSGSVDATLTGPIDATITGPVSATVTGDVTVNGGIVAAQNAFAYLGCVDSTGVLTTLPNNSVAGYSTLICTLREVTGGTNANSRALITPQWAVPTSSLIFFDAADSWRWDQYNSYGAAAVFPIRANNVNLLTGTEGGSRVVFDVFASSTVMPSKYNFGSGTGAGRYVVPITTGTASGSFVPMETVSTTITIIIPQAIPAGVTLRIQPRGSNNTGLGANPLAVFVAGSPAYSTQTITAPREGLCVTAIGTGSGTLIVNTAQ